MPHPNDMTAWPEIACRRGHDSGQHATRPVVVELGPQAPHGYRDLTQIPARFARRLNMVVWDPDRHPVDGGPYCPAHDAVSETIVSHRIWEPRESVLTLEVCSSAEPGQVFVDLGCQIGWFSLLAASCSTLHVVAIDADAECLRVVDTAAAMNPWGGRILTKQLRVGPDVGTLPVDRYRLVKMDLEGAEADGVALLWPSIELGLVDFMLLEISPVFRPGDHYGQLIIRLMDVGFDVYRLPPKQLPPVDMEHPRSALGAPMPMTAGVSGLLAEVASWHQEDLWFVRRGVEW